MLPMAVQLSGALHILTRAYHANNAINAFNTGKGLSSLENTHFFHRYLLHDRGCRNHAENAINPLYSPRAISRKRSSGYAPSAARA